MLVNMTTSLALKLLLSPLVRFDLFKAMQCTRTALSRVKVEKNVPKNHMETMGVRVFNLFTL